MNMLSTILMAFAFVFACFAAAGWPTWRLHNGWLAIALMILSILLGPPIPVFRVVGTALSSGRLVEFVSSGRLVEYVF